MNCRLLLLIVAELWSGKNIYICSMLECVCVRTGITSSSSKSSCTVQKKKKKT